MTTKTRNLPIAERIVTDPNERFSKPVVNGASIPVEQFLRQLAEKPDLADVQALYPELTLDDLRAVFAYAASAVQAVTASGQAANVARDADRWANYDPEKALQALDRLSKALHENGVDFKQWKAEIRQARGHLPGDDSD